MSYTQASTPDQISVWRVLYLAYRSIDVSYIDHDGTLKHLTHTLPDAEIEKATWAFQHFPDLVYGCSQGQARVEPEIRYVDRPLTSLTSMGPSLYWISPDDIRPELARYAPAGTTDSILVLWPQTHFTTGQQIPSGGWGLASGLGGCEWTHGATYGILANAPDWAWEMPTVGEPWLHEWLHDVSAFYTRQGCRLPHRDADGGDCHNYTRSATAGWLSYYQDLMTCNVLEDGQCTGIPAAAWRRGGILQQNVAAISADHSVGI
jgi:hypothetical protein